MNRRELIAGLVSLVAAPAIVRAGSLMPVRAMIIEPPPWIVFGASADGQIVERMRVTRSGIVLFGEMITGESGIVGELRGSTIC